MNSEKPSSPNPVVSAKIAIHNHLEEWADGYVFIGFEPTTGQPMIVSNVRDCKTALGINSLIMSIVTQGGVGMTNEPKGS